jgi:hypothetical protein
LELAGANCMNKPLRILAVIALGVTLTVGAGVGIVGYRGLRLWNIAKDFRAQIRYAVQTGDEVGRIPAEDALAVGYLESIFADNEELLEKLKGVVQRGLTDTDALQLGEVSAMLVTYHRNGNGDVKDVVAHVIGSFPLGKRKPGFHRDGYFRHLIEPGLWAFANSIINMLGRDMVIFAEEEIAQRHQVILEAVFSGDVVPLAESIEENPLYYSLVVPDPRKLVPLQMRHHVQAVVFKGMLAPEEGRSETILLTPSARSASYVLTILSDMKLASEVALRTKWKGVVEHTPWGPQIDSWWAYEMLQTSERLTIQKEYNIVRLRTHFGRVMVNAAVKSVERMGRDMAQMRGSLDERLDPRLVDERMHSEKPLHYWADSHRWGPNWPFKGSETNYVDQTPPPGVEATIPAAPAQTPGA